MNNFKKEDIENLSYKDIAYLFLENEKKGINTIDIFTKIVDILELPKSIIDTNIADFYTSLTTDKRFVMVDGLWDLRNRHTSDKVLSKIDDEEEEEEENVEETEENTSEDEDIFEEESIDDETTYDDDDDGLSDLVIVDEDEIDLENN